MQYKLTAPKKLCADIDLPASKSISNRVLIINALSGSEIEPYNIAECDDSEVMLRALRNKTATVSDVHGAGTAMRFLTAYYSVAAEGKHVLTGSKRMLSRPINILVDALRGLGTQIEYTENEGFPPLSIAGGLKSGGIVVLPADVSSQYVSALLMIAPKLQGGMTLNLLGDVASRPYIDMTVALMNEFGAKAAWQGGNTLKVEQGEYLPREFTIENDWSAASYWYEILALAADENSSFHLGGLSADSLQGDARVAKYFKSLGVDTVFTADGVTLSRSNERGKRVEFNLHGEPDLAQTLVVACAALGVEFDFHGLANLRIKETDRLAALATEMKKLGFVLEISKDGDIAWRGERCAEAEKVEISTYDDHRMAMSFAPLALCRRNIAINNPEVVAKSYPLYWRDLQNVGFKIEEQ